MYVKNVYLYAFCVKEKCPRTGGGGSSRAYDKGGRRMKIILSSTINNTI